MATNFGSDVTGMSNINLAPSKHIQSGVQDMSGVVSASNTLDLIKDVAPIVSDAYKAYQTVEMEKESINPIIDEARARHSIFMNTVEGKPNNNVTQYEKNTEIFKNALAQGRMSPQEYDTRVRDSLRQAVNKNPGMMKELSDHAATLLELSGTNAMIKDDASLADKIAKGQEEDRKYWLGLAKDNTITPTLNSDGSIDMNALIPRVQGVMQEKAVIESGDRLTKITADQARSFGTVYVTGKVNNAFDLATKVLQDPTIPFDKAKAIYTQYFEQARQDFNNDKRFAAILHTPEGKAMSDYMNNQIEAQLKNITSFASKEDAATYSKNMTNILRDSQYQDISKTVNPQMLDVVGKMLALPQVQAMLTSTDPTLKVKIFKTMTDLVGGISVNGVGNAYAPQHNGQNPPAAIAAEALIKEVGKPEVSESTTKALTNTISTINSDLQGKPDNERFLFSEKYVKVLGQPSAKDGLKKMDAGTISKVSSDVAYYLDTTAKGLQADLIKYDGDINVDLLPDGRLVVRAGSDPQLTTMINNKYIRRINDGLAAYANIHGYESTKEATQPFYDEYQEKLFPVTEGRDITDEDGEAASPEVINKMNRARQAGASTDEIAAATRRTKEWVNAQIGEVKDMASSLDDMIREKMSAGRKSQGK